MAEIIILDKTTSFYDMELDGEQLKITMSYSRMLDRWIMDIENPRLNIITNGIVINTAEDCAVSAGQLGIEVLVAVSTPVPFNDADFEHFTDSVKFLHMSLDEFNDQYYGGQAEMREKWDVDIDG